MILTVSPKQNPSDQNDTEDSWQCQMWPSGDLSEDKMKHYGINRPGTNNIWSSKQSQNYYIHNAAVPSSTTVSQNNRYWTGITWKLLKKIKQKHEK